MTSPLFIRILCFIRKTINEGVGCIFILEHCIDRPGVYSGGGLLVGGQAIGRCIASSLVPREVRKCVNNLNIMYTSHDLHGTTAGIIIYRNGFYCLTRWYSYTHTRIRIYILLFSIGTHRNFSSHRCRYMHTETSYDNNNHNWHLVIISARMTRRFVLDIRPLKYNITIISLTRKS